MAPPEHELDAIERWFVRRGLPHFVDWSGESSVLDTWTRALPLLVAAYLLLGLNALDLESWTVAENIATAGLVLVVLIGVWVVSNRMRGMPSFSRPTDIDTPELILFVVGPALPVVLFGQFGDAIMNIGTALLLLALIYLWSAYGLGPLLRWGIRRGTRHLASLGSLVARALPLLLVFNTFLFINAEVWEVAGTLQGPAYAVVIATFFLLGATFAVSRIPGVVRSLNHFESWNDVRERLQNTPAADLPLPDSPVPPSDQLRVRERVNIGLLVLFGQAVQITLVTAAIIAFFVGFGVMGIGGDTTANWTGLAEARVFADAEFGGRTLILTEPLLRVAVFLGAFSGMYFTVVLTTDDTYRSEFSTDAGPEIREALAVRTAYRVTRGTYPQIDGHGSTDRQTTGRPTSDNGVA